MTPIQELRESLNEEISILNARIKNNRTERDLGELKGLKRALIEISSIERSKA